MLGSETVTDAIFSAPVGSLEQIQDKDKTKQIGYWLVKVTERKETDDTAHVFGILAGSEEEAVQVKARLDKGEDFNTLAKEFSQVWSEENGADMGWIPSDSTDAAASYIFNPANPLNIVSPPIKDTNATTKGGYWVVKVVAAEDRALSTEDQDTMIGQLFDKWLTDLRANPDTKIESFFDQTRKDWALAYLEDKA
jgi:parvulin-like peptidyl-prolyl isomerase